MTPINFVSFYTPRPMNPNFQDYKPFLELQKYSCDLFGCRQIVITEPFKLDGFNTYEALLNLDLMLAILSGQVQYLESWIVDSGHTILTGADCILRKDPRPIFDIDYESFDVGFTLHPFHDCILNTGAIFIPKGSAKKVSRIWHQAISHLHSQLKIRWGDDQKALAQIVRPKMSYLNTIQVSEGLRYSFLPCTVYNWAPNDEDDPVPNTYIAHFRGQRKKWMKQWVKNFLPKQLVN